LEARFQWTVEILVNAPNVGIEKFASFYICGQKLNFALSQACGKHFQQGRQGQKPTFIM